MPPTPKNKNKNKPKAPGVPSVPPTDPYTYDPVAPLSPQQLISLAQAIAAGRFQPQRDDIEMQRQALRDSTEASQRAITGFKKSFADYLKDAPAAIQGVYDKAGVNMDALSKGFTDAVGGGLVRELTSTPADVTKFTGGALGGLAALQPSLEAKRTKDVLEKLQFSSDAKDREFMDQLTKLARQQNSTVAEVLTQLQQQELNKFGARISARELGLNELQTQAGLIYDAASGRYVNPQVYAALHPEVAGTKDNYNKIYDPQTGRWVSASVYRAMYPDKYRTPKESKAADAEAKRNTGIAKYVSGKGVSYAEELYGQPQENPWYGKTPGLLDTADHDYENRYLTADGKGTNDPNQAARVGQKPIQEAYNLLYSRARSALTTWKLTEGELRGIVIDMLGQAGYDISAILRPDEGFDYSASSLDAGYP